MKLQACITFLVLMSFFSNVNASLTQNAFQRPDQQAMEALNKGQAIQAETLFTRPEWKAVAYYRAGNYQQAYAIFKSDTTATGYYNSGNALVFLGRYADAITAYNQALKLQPHFDDAKFNKDLIEKLLQSLSQNKDNNSSANPPNNSSSDENSRDTNQATKNNPSSSQQTQNQPNEGSAKPTQASNSSSANKTTADENTADTSNSDSQSNKQARSDPSAKKTSAAATKPDQQAVNQWLQSIPDESGGLLEQKFLRDHAVYQQLQQTGTYHDEIP